MVRGPWQIIARCCRNDSFLKQPSTVLFYLWPPCCFARLLRCLWHFCLRDILSRVGVYSPRSPLCRLSSRLLLGLSRSSFFAVSRAFLRGCGSTYLQLKTRHGPLEAGRPCCCFIPTRCIHF